MNLIAIYFKNLIWHMMYFIFTINILVFFYIILFIENFCQNKKWGLGIGDWGLGIGDWGLGPIPNPQSPIPNPHYF